LRIASRARRSKSAFTRVFDALRRKRSDALQTDGLQNWDPNGRRVCDDPGSAAHRFTLHRIRETSVFSALRGNERRKSLVERAAHHQI
jgi:hypothetical protein